MLGGGPGSSDEGFFQTWCEGLGLRVRDLGFGFWGLP